MGLAICKGLIEAQGGKIWIQDQSGPGTIVSFTLPSIDGNKILTADHLLNQNSKEQDCMENVLVVDDEANILKLVSVNLLSRGYQVSEAKNGTEALAQLHSNHHP